MLALRQCLSVSLKNQRSSVTNFLLNFYRFIEDFLALSAKFSYISGGETAAEYVGKFHFHFKYMP
jgi:hypothetical protein